MTPTQRQTILEALKATASYLTHTGLHGTRTDELRAKVKAALAASREK